MEAVLCVPALVASNEYASAPKPLPLFYNKEARLRLAKALHDLEPSAEGTQLLRILRNLERGSPCPMAQ
jgi:hypothetical protein